MSGVSAPRSHDRLRMRRLLTSNRGLRPHRCHAASAAYCRQRARPLRGSASRSMGPDPPARDELPNRTLPAWVRNRDSAFQRVAQSCTRHTNGHFVANRRCFIDKRNSSQRCACDRTAPRRRRSRTLWRCWVLRVVACDEHRLQSRASGCHVRTVGAERSTSTTLDAMTLDLSVSVTFNSPRSRAQTCLDSRQSSATRRAQSTD